MVTADAGFLASLLVYETGTIQPNFWHWWSCSRSYGRVATALGVHAPEQWYCPPADYWAKVPKGSNFVCGGKNYSP